MPRLSVRRRSVVWLVVTYVAGVGLLAGFVPHRPRLTFPVPEYAHLIGFSPDGGRVAIASSSPWHAGLYNQPNDIAVWDVARRWPFAAATQIANRPAGWLNHLAWSWVGDPGREWLFWQCVGDDDVPARLGELLRIKVEAGDIDPTEDTPRIRVSPDGTYVASRTEEEAYRVFERDTGRECALTPPTKAAPEFGPSADEMTILEKMPTTPHVTVRRWNLKTVQEERLSGFDTPRGTGTRLTPGGRWLLAINGADDRANLVDPHTGSSVVSIAGYCRFVAPADRLIALDSGNRQRKYLHLQVHDTLGGVAESPTSLPTDDGFVRTAAVSPDGAVIAFSDHRMDRSVWNWPRPLQGIYVWLTSHGLNDHDGLLICDTRTGNELARLPGATGSVNMLTGEGVAAFSPDGRQLAVLNRGGVVRLFDWPLGRPWLFILTLAAVPPAFGSLIAIGFRRIRRRG
ncbi:MAG TPA: hypothetical protein VH120_17055 [Gemmataceae bacterium]|jgi:WD40 repeat protein|nr:hypothetical protein [Gemmataceae bacterium]